MACDFSYQYNTKIAPTTGPAGYEDYNGTGGDASISKPVYVTQTWVDQNSINVNRNSSSSTLVVFVKGVKDDWKDIPLVSDTVLNALADARTNDPDVLPTFIYGAILTSYNTQPINEQTWRVEVTYESVKPDDPNGGAGDNPGGDFTQDPVQTYKATHGTQQVQMVSGIQTQKSVGFFDQKGFKDPTFKKVEDGVNSNRTASVVRANVRFSVQKVYPVGSITSAFVKTISNLTGHLNKGLFNSFKQGSVMFTGADYSFDEVNKETVNYNFEVKEKLDITYPLFNWKFFAEDGVNAYLRENVKYVDFMTNPGKISFNKIPLLLNEKQKLVADGWDQVQFAYRKVLHSTFLGDADRAGSVSVTIGHQTIRTQVISNFDALGLGL